MLRESNSLPCEVYDYSWYWQTLAKEALEDMINHCITHNVNLDEFAQSIIDTNEGCIIHVDFRQKKRIG